MKTQNFLLATILSLLLCSSCRERTYEFEASSYDLEFTDLAKTWDEGMPLGNGIVGALIWQNEDMLRLSLDHVGLWDERPMINYDSIPVRNFKWVEEKVRSNDYRPVQQMYDVPYDTSAYPTKIPGAALEFDIKPLGKINKVHLYLDNAVNLVEWESGSKMYSFIHPSENIGWFRFENVNEGFVPVIIPPTYEKPTGLANDPVGGHDLRRLGYKQGDVVNNDQVIVYTQEGSNGFEYQVAVNYRKTKSGIEGTWSISTNNEDLSAESKVKDALKRGYHQDFSVHQQWWKQYWAKSSITIPDAVLTKQYHNELYKFGSAARSYSPPISLQAVWTADNGKLPPWKGDYHHDLNTQLSYWHAYTANHLDESMGYVNWLLKVKDTNKKYTKAYFGSDGLAVPGVTTLSGEPMAGWIQYSFGTTVSAWLSQHIYMQWQYSQDMDFLKEYAYPYVQDVLTLFDQLSVRDEDGKRSLPISSSPEIFDNSIRAWFLTITNFDLALIRFVYTAAIDMARVQGLDEDAKRYETTLSEWPDFDVDEENVLTFAKGFPYEESHRHLSNAMAIHPLGLLDVSQGGKNKEILEATIERIGEIGPNYWVGYSYSWFGNLKARALDGDGAAEALRIFAEHFCLRNTFHVNGDQTKMGYSLFTYRPFTLEGNFAFAAGVQEMLIQSHTGVIRVFPAIPDSWKDVSFKSLRTVGAFLVSAEKKDGEMKEVVIESEKGGLLRIKNPFADYIYEGKSSLMEKDGILYIDTNAGETICLRAKH